MPPSGHRCNHVRNQPGRATLAAPCPEELQPFGKVAQQVVGERVLHIYLDADQCGNLDHEPNAVQVEHPKRQRSFRPVALQPLQVRADHLKLLP